MPRSGIYVEIPIKAPMESLWLHTQDPLLHKQWDLRFTNIEYIPKKTENQVQRFLYETKIGAGLKITGEGETQGDRDTVSGMRTSALKFWSEIPYSLIQKGSGYWKYDPQGDHIRFLTWYDYTVRFGLIGKVFDLSLFRPLLGWATALSFDTLRLWLERSIKPNESFRRFFIDLLGTLSLGIIWIYQGIVPKLLLPETGELQLLQATGFFGNNAGLVLTLIGMLEVLFGLLFLFWPRKLALHIVNIFSLLSLLVVAFVSNVQEFVKPFNPATLTIAMIAISLMSIINLPNVPRAANCLRREKK